MGFKTWLNDQAAQGREHRIANLDQKVRVEEAKAAKTFRRSGKHIREADRLQARAEKLRDDGS